MLVRSAVSVASDAAVVQTMAPIGTSILPASPANPAPANPANRANPNLVPVTPVTPGSGGAAASPAAGFGGGVPFDSLCRFEDLSCLPRR